MSNNERTNGRTGPEENLTMRTPSTEIDREGGDSDDEIRVAFVGNSILYFNDCPRVLERMLLETHHEVTQSSCLRGGSSLKELWTQGNGMATKFTHDMGAPSVQALLHDSSWDFIVMNDFTQGPARQDTRHESKLMLERCYAPLIRSCGAIPVILQTAAYRKPIRGTDDLGTVEEWTLALEQGCQEYVAVLNKELPESQAALLAPVGNAFLKIYQDNHDLWEKLFYTDNFHPSPHGTWLQACILYCTLTRETPPAYLPDIWDSCRYMQRLRKKPSPLPTMEEAETLRRYACDICGVHSKL